LYGHRRYIAAQGPIDESLNDFFQMIWEFHITSIICTANDIEAGRVGIIFMKIYSFIFHLFQFKFRRYWPDDDEEFLQFGSYKITKVK
jgi:hypothetical protein